MNEILLFKFLHIVGFAYWLGADIGVFYCSYFVANDKLSSSERMTTAKILFALDQIPRMCMTMMLPLGVHLAWRLGILKIDATVMALIWLLGAGWLATVIVLHAAQASRWKTLLSKFDFWFRFALASGLLGTGVAGLRSVGVELPYWISLKLTIFGGLVACGLIVRMRLRDFGPAFASLARGEATDADNAAIRRSLGGTRPFVVLIWTGLLASTALGIHLI